MFGSVAGTATSVSETTEQRNTRAGFGHARLVTRCGECFRSTSGRSPTSRRGSSSNIASCGRPAIFLALAISIRREWSFVLRVMREPGSLLMLAAGGVLIAVNWLVFVYAVVSGHVLEASLGYFINPLFLVALGMVFMRERLRPWQGVAVVIAGMAVANLTFRGEHVSWIALSLAVSFGLYGLVRKKVNINSLHGLLVETLVLLPAALIGLVSFPLHQPTPGTLGLLCLASSPPRRCCSLARRCGDCRSRQRVSCNTSAPRCNSSSPSSRSANHWITPSS